MKQFYALITLVFTMQATAQYTQNFDAVNSLTTGCNLTVNSDRTATAGEIINGTASLYSNPPVNGSGTRDYLTPYLNIVDPSNPAAVTTSFSVSFNYKLNEALNGQAVRTIEIGLQSLNGFTSLSTITMDKDNDPLTPVAFNQTYTVAKGVYRLVLKMGGSQGNGSVRIIIDDIAASASAYYSFSGTCNTAPSAANDVYFTSNYTSPTTFTSVLANDSEPNGETFSTPVVSTVSPDGTVVFNLDGSFTFTPNAGFAGSSTTFSYLVSDNGYEALTATGTATIHFGAGAVLPVKLINFNASMVKNKAALTWSIANNEDGHRIEVEKSTDGKTFSTGSVVMATLKQGTERYEYKESSEAAGRSFYRLKIVSRNNTISYSGLIKLDVDQSIADASSLVLMQNPVRNSVNFSYQSTENAITTISVYDISGRKLFSRQWNTQKGMNITAIDLNSRILAGTYLLEVVNGSGRSVAKFVKQ